MQQIAQEPFWYRLLEKPEILGVMLPIVAVIALAVVVIVKLFIRHRERMALIEHGIHPDYPPEDDESKQNPPMK